MKSPRIAVASVVSALGIATCGFAGAADISSYCVVKLHRFTQLPGEDPVVNSREYGGQFRVVPGLLVDDVQILNSRPQEIPLTVEDEEAYYEVTTKTLNAINIAFPVGNFQFTIATQIDGIVLANLALPDAEFPAAPRVTNLAALQDVPVDAPIPVSWEAFGVQRTDDIIEFRVRDSGGVLVFTSGTLADDPHPDGTATGTAIPAGVLVAGNTYEGDLRFLQVVERNTLDYPGALGIAALASETVFNFTTGGSTVTPFRIDSIQQLNDGRIQIRFHGQPGLTYRVNQSLDLNEWTKLVDVVAPLDGNALAEDATSGEAAKFYRVTAP